MPLGAFRLNSLAKFIAEAAATFTGIIKFAAYDDVSFSVSEFGSPNDIRFGNNGLRMYVGGNTVDAVRQYNLTTAYNISTASYANKSLSYANTPNGMFIKPDGTKLYICDTNAIVAEYNLSTAWEIDSASLVTTKSVSSQVTFARSVAFSVDGTKMYVGDQISGQIHQYSLSTAWSVASATYSNKTIDFGAYGLYITNDGTALYANNPSYVRKYNLSTPFDISTGTLDSLYNITINDFMSGLDFSPDGAKMYTTGYSTAQAVYQYSTNIAAILRSDAYASNVRLAVPFSNSAGINDLSKEINSNSSPAEVTRGPAATLSSAQVKWTSSPNYVKSYLGNTGLGSALTYQLSTSIPSCASGGNTYVVEGWFRANNATSNANWCLSSADSGGRWLFGINSGTTFSFANENNIGIGSGWHHLAIVLDGGTKRFYYDGIYKGAWVSSNTGFTTLNVGQFNSGDSNDYRGYIQDLRVTIGSNRGYTGTNTGSANFTLPSSIIQSF